MKSFRRIAVALISALASILVLTVPAHAQSVAEFYKGKQVTIVVGAPPGGGYDLWARAIARHMGKHIPGNPSFVAQNMPGAGTLVAANHVYSIAPKDGTVIGSVARDAALAPLTGLEGRFDAHKFLWLGSPTDETNVCIATKRGGVASYAELLQRELIIGDTGPGAGTYVFPRVLNAMFGTKFKVIPGYSGSAAVFLAMQRGEVHGICESLDSVMRRSADSVKSGEVILLFQGGAERNPTIKDVPFVFDFAKTEEQTQALTFLYAAQGIGRPFLAPPDLPPERATALRDAFAATMTDPEFVADAKKQGLDVEAVPGAKIEAILKQIYATPKPVIDKITQILQTAK
jgi:tripartite-type tricarboxylate transporter receptor subunit TctC